MPLPIIEDVYQARLIWSDPNAQRPATNNLHLLDSAGSGSQATIWADLDASVTANLWQLVSTNSVIDNVDITPLDGISASTRHATGGPAKWKGSGGTDPILQGAIVVTLRSANRGQQWRNRIYLPFVGETGQAAGLLTPANVIAMQTAWDAFVPALTAAGSPLVVVSPSLSSYSPVTQAVVRPYLKTQRRRARR